MLRNIKILKPQKRELSEDKTKWEEKYSISEMLVNLSHIVKGDIVQLPFGSLPEGLQAKVFTEISLSNGDRFIMVGGLDDDGRVLLKG